MNAAYLGGLWCCKRTKLDRFPEVRLDTSVCMLMTLVAYEPKTAQELIADAEALTEMRRSVMQKSYYEEEMMERGVEDTERLEQEWAE
jgi:predicted metal-binding transcription factor (methanogenesis marker protein 9)